MFARWATLAVLLFCWAGIAAAQSVTTDIRRGEVLWVQGNTVVVRGPAGVNRFDVDDDVRFNLDGKELSVHELKPGMTFTAVVKTTTTPVQEYATEVKQGEVINTLGSTIVVRMATGEYKKFTADDLKNIDVAIMKDGKAITASELKKGDRISATIITPLPPTSLSETELAVVLKSPPPPPPPRAVAQPPAAPPAPKPVPPPPAEPKPAKLPKTGSPIPLVGLTGLVALALGASLSVRRRRAASR
jgi:LPXTG-motif cell wall-anchored protein